MSSLLVSAGYSPPAVEALLGRAHLSMARSARNIYQRGSDQPSESEEPTGAGPVPGMARFSDELMGEEDFLELLSERNILGKVGCWPCRHASGARR